LHAKIQNGKPHEKRQFREKGIALQVILNSVLLITLKEYIVAYLLEARTVEREKPPLLANGSETAFVTRQWPRNKQQNNVHC
jgi:hypothetical protein